MKTLRVERVEMTKDAQGCNLAPGQYVYAFVVMDEKDCVRFNLPTDMAEYLVDYIHGVTQDPQTFVEL